MPDDDEPARTMMSSRRLLLISMALVAGPALVYLAVRAPILQPLRLRITGKRTVSDRLGEFGDSARQRLAPHFELAGVTYPPSSLVLAAFKRERTLGLYAPAADGKVRHITSYPFTAASGRLGPKLRQGDLQVPEGVYRITYLNPNSAYHASLRVDYPNAVDLTNAKIDGRADLGGDIMIHGRAASIGCIAIGDPAIEEVFTVSADVGILNIKCIISPVDTRSGVLPSDLPAAHSWTKQLYEVIDHELRQLPVPEAKRSR